MAQGKIKVTIDHLGKPKIEAVGFQGTSCTAATASIEKALSGGTSPTVTVLKPEFYETENQTETAYQNQY